MRSCVRKLKAYFKMGNLIPCPIGTGHNNVDVNTERVESVLQQADDPSDTHKNKKVGFEDIHSIFDTLFDVPRDLSTLILSFLPDTFFVNDTQQLSELIIKTNNESTDINFYLASCYPYLARYTGYMIQTNGAPKCSHCSSICIRKISKQQLKHPSSNNNNNNRGSNDDNIFHRMRTFSLNGDHQITSSLIEILCKHSKSSQLYQICMNEWPCVNRNQCIIIQYVQQVQIQKIKLLHNTSTSTDYDHNHDDDDQNNLDIDFDINNIGYYKCIKFDSHFSSYLYNKKGIICQECWNIQHSQLYYKSIKSLWNNKGNRLSNREFGLIEPNGNTIDDINVPFYIEYMNKLCNINCYFDNLNGVIKHTPQTQLYSQCNFLIIIGDFVSQDGLYFDFYQLFIKTHLQNQDFLNRLNNNDDFCIYLIHGKQYEYFMNNVKKNEIYSLFENDEYLKTYFNQYNKKYSTKMKIKIMVCNMDEPNDVVTVIGNIIKDYTLKTSKQIVRIRS